MSAHFLLRAIKEARYETIAQRLRIEELLQKVQQLETENAALRSLVQHWYKLVPENIRSSIEDAQKEAKP